MATCPKCGGQMPMKAPVCPHCGYDFPLRGEFSVRLEKVAREPRSGPAFSPFADIVLTLGAIICGVGSVVTLFEFWLSVTHPQGGIQYQLLSAAIVSAAICLVFWRSLDGG